MWLKSGNNSLQAFLALFNLIRHYISICWYSTIYRELESRTFFKFDAFSWKKVHLIWEHSSRLYFWLRFSDPILDLITTFHFINKNMQLQKMQVIYSCRLCRRTAYNLYMRLNSKIGKILYSCIMSIMEMTFHLTCLTYVMCF
jgi:hypothetical protein